MNKTKCPKDEFCNNYLPINLIAGQLSPSDGTTYYGGLAMGSSLNNNFSTTDGLFALAAPFSGRIIRAVLGVQTPGTTSTAEPSTVYLRINGVDYLISNAVLTNARNTVNTKTFPVKPYVRSGLDFLQIKFVAASWATNPTNVSMFLTLYVQEN